MAPIGAPHAKIALPRDLFGAERNNSAGLDLSNEHRLASLSSALAGERATLARRADAGRRRDRRRAAARDVTNPADHAISSALSSKRRRTTSSAALAHASRRRADLASHAGRRARRLPRARRRPARSPDATLMGLVVREAGKSLPNAIAEIREAVDFLRYYAGADPRRVRQRHASAARPGRLHQPVEFPAGDFHRPGRRRAGRRQCGAGQAGRADAADRRAAVRAAARSRHAGAARCNCCRAAAKRSAPRWWPIRASRGVMFTGSTEVARLINRTLAKRLDPDGKPIPLIAETGGQNAMIVDSSALPSRSCRTCCRRPSTAPVSVVRRCACCVCRTISRTGRSRCSRARCANWRSAIRTACRPTSAR